VETAVAPGILFDATGDRFLYIWRDDVTVNDARFFSYYDYVGETQPRVLDRESQQAYAPAPSNLTTNLTYGILGSTSALLGSGPIYGLVGWLGWATNNPEIIRGGGSLPAINGSRNAVQVAGDSVAWVNYDGPFWTTNLFLRDIVNPNKQFVIGADGGFRGFDLALNMDLVYAVSNQIFRSRPATPAQPYVNRATTQLTFGDSASSPATDGTNVVFSRAISNSTITHVVLLAPSGEETLAIGSGSGGADYRARNGWVAFTKPGSVGQSQIWTRSPSGAALQRTFFNSSSTLESLGPNGEVTFLFSGGRYLSLPGAAPWWVNSGQGMVRWQDEKLLLLLGRSVFEVVTGRLSSSLLASGDVKMNFNGPHGIACTLQSSANLRDWSDSLRFTNSSGTMSWTNPPGSTQQFHRTVTAIR
jgi:hypothetical protein